MALAGRPGAVHSGDDALAADGGAGDGFDVALGHQVIPADELRQELGVILHLAQEGHVVRRAGVAHGDAGDGGVLIHADGHIEGTGQALALLGEGFGALGDAHLGHVGLGGGLSGVGGGIIDEEQYLAHRAVDRAGRHGGAGHGIQFSRRHGGLAHKLVQVIGAALHLGQVADIVGCLGVLHLHRGHGAVGVQGHHHGEGAADALGGGAVAVIAQLLDGHHRLLELDIGHVGDVLGGLIDAADHGAAGDGRRRDGVDLAAVLAQVNGIGFARELFIEGGLLRFGAQAGGLAEVGAAHAHAGQRAFAVHAHGHLHRAAKARDGAHRHIAHGVAVGVDALEYLGFTLGRDLLKIGSRRKQFLADGHGLFGLLSGDAVLCAVVRRAKGQGGHQRDDGQHDPCGQFLTHCIFLQAMPLPLGEEGD